MVPMIEKHLDIPTADGAMNSFVVYPDEGGPHPVVLFYMDAPGKREELHDMARRLASVGYYVVLPNLYYRNTPDWWLTERTEANMGDPGRPHHRGGYCRPSEVCRRPARGAGQPLGGGRLLHERAICDVGSGAVWGPHQLHCVHPRGQHGNRRT